MDTKPEAKDDVDIDPLRRVFVPIEKKNVMGQFTFQTKDGKQYIRRADGSIRRNTPKKTTKRK